MRNVGFSQSEIEEVLDQVVAILNLGNVDFTDTGNAVQPTLETKDYLITCAELLKVDLASLAKCLTKKSMKIAGETIETSLSLDQSLQARDTFAKQLYSQLFSWIIQKVN
jgi:myosin heavy subunit